VAAVSGHAIAVNGGDPNERREAHGRNGKVTQGIVIRPFPLHAAESEALGRQAA